MSRLADMEVKENELAAELISTMRLKNETDSITIKNLFPEFELSGLYGLHRAREPLTKYLVMYDTVIVNLYLLKDEKQFLEIYGVTIAQMKTLQDMGKIHIVFCFPYDQFPDAFSPLLEALGPRSSRTRNYLARVHDLNQDMRHEQVKNIDWSGEHSKYPASVEKDITTFWGMHSSDLFDLDLVGLNDVADRLIQIAKINPTLSFKLARDYCSFLARPVFDCLGGMNTYNKDDEMNARSILLKTDVHALATECHFDPKAVRDIEGFLGVHPSDLVKFFPKEFYVPNFEGVEDIEGFVSQIENQEDVKVFRNMLHQLAKNQKQNPDISDLSGELIARLKRDARLYGIKSDLFKDAIWLGVNAVPYIPAMTGDTKLIALSGMLGPAYSSVVGSRTSQIEGWSKRIFESLSNTHIEKPIVSAFHKATSA